MRASKKFVDLLYDKNLLSNVAQIRIELYGSLALTGVGHGTDYAVLMGLEGESPEYIDPTSIKSRIQNISKSKTLNLRKEHQITFIPIQHLVWYTNDTLQFNTYCVRYIAYNDKNDVICSEDFYSVGGGFVIRGDPAEHNAYLMVEEESPNLDAYDAMQPPHKFDSAAHLLRLARAHECNISDITRKNELHWRTEEEINKELTQIWNVMNQSIQNGINTKGLLQTKAKRRASNMYEMLKNADNKDPDHPLNSIEGPHYSDWISCWAMAVNEENATGGRVVTAPTLRYIIDF